MTFIWGQFHRGYLSQPIDFSSIECELFWSIVSRWQHHLCGYKTFTDTVDAIWFHNASWLENIGNTCMCMSLVLLLSSGNCLAVIIFSLTFYKLSTMCDSLLTIWYITNHITSWLIQLYDYRFISISYLALLLLSTSEFTLPFCFSVNDIQVIKSPNKIVGFDTMSLLSALWCLEVLIVLPLAPCLQSENNTDKLVEHASSLSYDWNAL